MIDIEKIKNELSAKYGLNCTQIKEKPWGFTIGIDCESVDQFIKCFFLNFNLSVNQVSPRFLIVNSGSRLSWQWHQRRAELWRVVLGPVGVMLSNDDLQPDQFTLNNTDSVIKIEPGVRHRLIGLSEFGIVAELWFHTNPDNPSDKNDIVRVENDYTRKAN